MILIGICGASGSGKSTLADALANRLGDRCLVIQQDCYYRDHPDLSFSERAKPITTSRAFSTTICCCMT